MPNVKLRDAGIYILRDGRQFIVKTTSDGSGYLLYSPEAWERGPRLAEYRADRAGRIFNKGRLTGWRIEDLKDTGRTAAQRRH